MIILYCEKCGVRVSEEDLQRGVGSRMSESQVACGKCAGELRKPVVAHTKPSGEKNSSRLREAHLPARTKQKMEAARANKYVIGAVSLVVAVVILRFFSASEAPSKTAPQQPASEVAARALKVGESASKARDEKPPETNITATLPTRRAMTDDEDELPKPNKAPQQTTDPELTDIRREISARTLLDAKRSYSENPAGVFEFHSKLRGLAATYRDLPAGEEAAALLKTIKLPSTGVVVKFIKSDPMTRGNWKGVYGSEGYMISQTDSKLTGIATVKLRDIDNYTWNTDANDLAGLQTETGRICSCWHTPTTMSADIEITDGKSHQLALYFVDQGGSGRKQSVEIIDLKTEDVIDSRDIPSSANGVWFLWNISGKLRVRVINKGGTNAVLSGIFFDPASQ